MTETTENDQNAQMAELTEAENRLARIANSLSTLPRGCLVRKVIKGRPFFYLAYRDGARIRFEYKGRLSPAEQDGYIEAAKNRAGLRREASGLRARLALLKRKLRIVMDTRANQATPAIGSSDDSASSARSGAGINGKRRGKTPDRTLDRNLL